MKEERLLRVGRAASLIGIHPQTLRSWTRQGRIGVLVMGPRQERRYRESDVLAFAAGLYGMPEPERQAVLYLRVSGSNGQESSLVSQEAELRARAEQEGVQVIAVAKDRASGLNEKRTGLSRALSLLAKGEGNEIWVTHADRLARFGVDWLRALVESHDGQLVILHTKETSAPEEELMADFMALIASFSGRLYGQRSAALRRQLLAAADSRIADE
jgi:predicted site-specific integrase-resolvase